MERTTSIKKAKEIMGKNFIGLDELLAIQGKMGIYIPEDLKTNCPFIPFSENILEKSKNDYILILGVPYHKDKTPLTIVKMREHFGYNPDISEPCFYNQDWYFREAFAEKNKIKPGWYLLSKSIRAETRGIPPEELISSIPELHLFPSAILCAYTFFCYYLFTGGHILWRNDYLWCSDFDNNSDRIYVGRYIDSEKKNKNGFSIHRQLSIKACYGLAPLRVFED
jgi:hypothetical protein